MDEQLDEASPDERIAALAARQHGVVSRDQLRAAGLGRGAIDHRRRTGRLHDLHRGVYNVGHPAVSREGRWIAAVLAYGDRAALSHTSALALWELRPSSATRIDVIVRTGNGLARRDGIRVHCCAAMAVDEITRHRSIAVTTVARSLLDGAAALSLAGISRAVERADGLGLFDLAKLQRLLARHRTHPGAGPLAAALELYRDDEPTRSELEAMFVALCHELGLPRPLVNHAISGYEVDFLWPEQRLVVEVDGRTTHLTRAGFERDRARDATLVVAGLRVVRFTYRRIRDEPRAVAATLRALLGMPPAPATRRAR